MSSRAGLRVTFITGTDTGVGKTTLTALLLTHLRRRGAPAFALKPFCSGGRGDAELFFRLQEGDLALDEINPYYFAEPVAPLVAAKKSRKVIPIARVVEHITRLGAGLPEGSHLLVEGAGGLFVPLGPNYTVLDLILALRCELLVVAANRLGTINHTLLTVEAARNAGAVIAGNPRSLRRTLPKRQGAVVRLSRVVVMNQRQQDVSSRTNVGLLRKFLPSVPVVTIPFLGPAAASAQAVKKNEKKFQKTLARILD